MGDGIAFLAARRRAGVEQVFEGLHAVDSTPARKRPASVTYGAGSAGTAPGNGAATGAAVGGSTLKYARRSPLYNACTSWNWSRCRSCSAFHAAYFVQPNQQRRQNGQ